MAATNLKVDVTVNISPWVSPFMHLIKCLHRAHMLKLTDGRIERIVKFVTRYGVEVRCDKR